MFQPNRMNQIDNFFMRNNNQVTPKRSYSPRLVPQNQDNFRHTPNMQYFPANKQNVLPNRTSVSPNKVNFTRKPMIAPLSNNNVGPSLLVSPRSKGHNQGINIQSNEGYSNHQGGFQQELNKPRHLSGQNFGAGGLLKRLNQNGSEVQFVMSKGVEYCQNHGNKLAQFFINIEGQKMKYCNVCASKLASQGFTVVKISAQLQKKQIGRSLRKPKPIPNYPQYRGNPFYQQINQFLRQLVAVQTNHYETITKFSSLQQHYSTQIDLTTQYYDQVIKILTQMKQQHLQDLVQQKQKNVQIADIQVDHLNQNIQQISYMRQDIESNIPSIVTDIEQDNFKECVYEYRNKMEMLKHSLEEKEENLKDVTEYTEQELRKKVERFQNAMKQLWNDQSDNKGKETKTNGNNKNQANTNQHNQHNQHENTKEQPVSIKHMHQILPKSSVQQTQGQGAFRHLFGDEQENDQTLPIPSPQFKKI